MSKRRKRRRLAWINRFQEVIQENPGITTAAAKEKTEQDMRKALNRADFLAETREQHQQIVEETLQGFRKQPVQETKIEETVAKPTLTKVEPEKPKSNKKVSKTVAEAKAKKTIAKPKVATAKTTAAKKPTATKKTTTAKKTTTRKRTTTTKSKKS